MCKTKKKCQCINMNVKSDLIFFFFFFFHKPFHETMRASHRTHVFCHIRYSRAFAAAAFVPTQAAGSFSRATPRTFTQSRSSAQQLSSIHTPRRAFAFKPSIPSSANGIPDHQDVFVSQHANVGEARVREFLDRHNLKYRVSFVTLSPFNLPMLTALRR
jgi:hypothetical protein